jgi:signal transduction histidine kinase
MSHWSKHSDRYLNDVLVGLAFACCAVILRWALDPYLGDRQPFTPIHAVTALALWRFSWRVAVVNAVAGQLLASYLFVPPRGELLPNALWLVGLVTYYLEALMIIYFGQVSKRVLRQKDLFLSTLAHEITNPVAALRNAIGIMKMQKWDPEEGIEILDGQMHQLTTLVEDMRDINLTDRGRMQIRRKNIDLRDCISHAVYGTADLLDGRQRKLKLDLPDYPLTVHADPARMVQCFVNLIGNAVKYSPSVAEIKVHGRLVNGKVTVIISDKGVGIESEELSRIFDCLYVRNKPLSGDHGMGIGLWLTKRLVELHGGTISASSRGHGRGSDFTVTLPGTSEEPIADTAWAV